MSSDRVSIPGSHRAAYPGAQLGEAPNPDQLARATVVLRRRADPPAEAYSGTPLSPAEVAERYGADPADVQAVTAALTDAGIDVLSVDPGSRRIRIAAPLGRLSQFFGTELREASTPDGRAFRQRTGDLQVPADLDGKIVAVLGLDNRPQARALLRVAAAAQGNVSYTPPQLATIYGMPAGDGTGRSIAIIELGGGYRAADLQTYFGGLGVSVPSVTDHGVDGASNGGGTDPSVDGEVLLDIEVAGAIAPAANIAVYFAPNTDDGFLDAVSTAAHASPTPTAMSISWGGSEDSWTESARTALDGACADAALLGCTITVAAGDSGSSDGSSGVHVDFPASSPHVLACGGTSLRADPSTGKVSSETVWNGGISGGATGGGVSDAFAVPDWQQSAGVPTQSGGSATGRGVPDVAAVADPRTGYQVLVDGQQTVVGGTSAVAPLWAGLICRLAQGANRAFGLLQTELYTGVSAGQAATGFRDITQGNNGAYSAGKGWDACTGLGVPDGAALAKLLGDG